MFMHIAFNKFQKISTKEVTSADYALTMQLEETKYLIKKVNKAKKMMVRAIKEAEKKD